MMRETLRWGSPRRLPISVWDPYTTLGKTGAAARLAFRAVLSLTGPATLEVRV
ncbi:MAG: hypothetical protein M3Q60_13675 [Actinomycetota bacterium]|nr:hypothetical protein [Actinomycetota bacterium]